MSPTGTPIAMHPTVAVRHRPSVSQMTTAQLASLRQAISATQAINDDRGYQSWAGIHGLPLPISCQHGTPLFLPWHRAYLYLFEQALRDQAPDVVLPWWDWTVDQAVPEKYAAADDGDGSPNPLLSSPIQPAARAPGVPDHTTRAPGANGAPPLPTPEHISGLLQLGDFTDFSTQLEDVHNGVHTWVGGTMGEIPVAAYDPLFWAHHTMIDRVWRLWQVAHPHGGPPSQLTGAALSPFGMTVVQTLDVASLGYDYAASAASIPGTS